jgi:hypothetical protein
VTTCPGCANGWYWTQGWGNLFTVVVAVAAIAVSAWYNRRTLRNANAIFDQGRIDARNDKLRAEIAGLMGASGDTRVRQDMFLHRLGKSSRDPRNQSMQARERLQESLKADFSEVLGDAYNRIGVHMISAKLLLLNDDQTIRDHIDRIGELSRQQQEFIHTLIDSVKQPGPTAAINETEERELEDEKTALLEYLVNEWEPATRRPHSLKRRGWPF